MSVPNRDKPAFPPNGGWRDNDPLSRGLSKREHFAAMAMQGLMASETADDVFESSGVAERSVELADALLDALEVVS